MQRSFDAQAALLERREREIGRNAAEAREALKQAAEERQRLVTWQKKLDDREKALKTEVLDKGFEDSLAVYNAMQPKQVKGVFGPIGDAAALRDLRGMDAS